MRSLTLALLCLVCAACRCNPSDTPDAGPSDSGMLAYDEFDAWREIRTVVRASPDAVQGRAEALVAAKDAEGLFALVRDDLALLPTSPLGFDGADTVVRWGARAALRGQAGTPRERAELLKNLYVQAGFTAEVVSGPLVSGKTTTALLARGPQRTITYASSDEQVARWQKALPRKSTAPPAPTPLDADAGVRTRIVDSFRSLLPADTNMRTFTPTYPGDVPLVKVTVAGATKYANPNVDGAVFGESYTLGDPMPAPPAGNAHRVKVTVEAERSTRPSTKFQLAEMEWTASDVAGRTITLAFSVPASNANAARMKVQDATTFIPTLIVRGDGLDLEAAQRLSKVGTPVTLGGDVVQIGSNRVVTLDGETLAAPPTAAALLTSVTGLEMSASAVAYPDVELLVKAKGAGTATVPGLASDAFIVKEAGQNVVAQLRRTKSPAPRVVLAFDLSTSIPDEFRTGAPAVGHAVADAIFVQFPGAQVQVATVDINAPTLAGPLVSTITEVDAQLAMLSGTGSEIHTAVDVLGADRPTCIVLITDAAADDMLSPEIAARLAAGPPVLVAGVGTIDMTIGARLAEVTRGRFITPVTAMTLPGQVTSFIAERAGYDYRIVYRSTTAGTASRMVTVSLAMPGTATVSASYTPPATPIEPGALSALYVTVETNGQAVTRLLAGSSKGTVADRKSVQGALFGKYVLGVEAGPPSASTLFDEYFAERLQLEPLIDALRSQDAVKIAAAAKISFSSTPTDLRWVSASLPAPSAGAFVMTDGLSIALHSTRPVIGVKVVRSIDLLPLVPRQVVKVAGGTTNLLTTEATAGLAAFEAVRFTKNTRTALAGKTLAKFDPLTVEMMLGPSWAGVAYPSYSDYDVYAPADGSVVAFWAVHKQTGQLIGVMPEGGIGEGESTEVLVDRLLTILDAAGRTGELFGYEGVKAWADLEATKVNLLGSVIMLFEGEGRSGPSGPANAACGEGLNAIGGQIPGWDNFNMGINDLQSIYRTIHVGTGVDMPPVMSPVEMYCSALTGG